MESCVGLSNGVVSLVFARCGSLRYERGDILTYDGHIMLSNWCEWWVKSTDGGKMARTVGR